MAKEYAIGFYNSTGWIKCRNTFMDSKYYMCESCGELAKICHHKKHITPMNISDPSITLSWSNLMALCHECHQKIHGNTDITVEGTEFDEKGNLVYTPGYSQKLRTS